MENVIENNRLIAEFMGSKYVNKPYKDRETGEMVDFFYWTEPCNGYPKDMNITPPSDLSTAFMIENFSYHKSFDWLMPVVDKIKNDDSCKISLPMGGLNDSIVPYLNAIRPLNKALLHFNQQSIYTSVVAFIKWYNNHKPPLTPINDNNH